MRVVHTCLIAIATTFLAALPAFSGGKAEKVAFEVYAKGYFVKNTVKLPGNSAFMVITDMKAFDDVFGFGRVIGPMPKTVESKLFEKNLIVTAIKAGSALTTFDAVQVRRDKDKLIVQYKATTGAPSSAKYVSPLIVAVPRGDYTEVVFVENGKEAGKAAVK